MGSIGVMMIIFICYLFEVILLLFLLLSAIYICFITLLSLAITIMIIFVLTHAHLYPLPSVHPLTYNITVIPTTTIIIILTTIIITNIINFSAALLILQTGKMISQLLRACQTLELSTQLSKKCSKVFAEV